LSSGSSKGFKQETTRGRGKGAVAEGNVFFPRGGRGRTRKREASGQGKVYDNHGVGEKTRVSVVGGRGGRLLNGTRGYCQKERLRQRSLNAEKIGE